MTRYRWPQAAGAVLFVLLSAACSGGTTARTQPAPSVSAEPSPTGVTPKPSGDARAILARVLAATRALHSYRFAAVQTVSGGPAPQTTRLTGRALRPGSLTYLLVTGGHTEQIVRIGATTYRRVPPGRYKRLVAPPPASDPLSSVLAVLMHLRDVTTTRGPSGVTFSGSLSGADAAAAGLVGNAAPGAGLTVPITVQVDRRARVTRLQLTAPLRAGSRLLMLRQVTTYAGFDMQPAIPRPR